MDCVHAVVRVHYHVGGTGASVESDAQLQLDELDHHDGAGQPHRWKDHLRHICPAVCFIVWLELVDCSKPKGVTPAASDAEDLRDTRSNDACTTELE